MKPMGLRGELLPTLLTAALAFTSLHASAQQHSLLLDTSEVRVTVRDSAGLPVPDARVIMHVLKRGADQGEMEVRTNDAGTVEQDIIPLGNVVRLQVSAPGYQAYGTDYPVNALVKDLVIRLKQQPALTQQAMNEAPAPLPASNASSSSYKEAQWVAKPAKSSARHPHPAGHTTEKPRAQSKPQAAIAKK